MLNIKTKRAREATIAATACPICCAMRKEPCRFNAAEDPDMAHTRARDSHPARYQIFQKNIHTAIAPCIDLC